MGKKDKNKVKNKKSAGDNSVTSKLAEGRAAGVETVEADAMIDELKDADAKDHDDRIS